MAELFVGLMSGTSMDAIDAVLVSFDASQPTLIANLSQPLTAELRHRLTGLASPGNNELTQMMELDVIMGRAFAETTRALLEKATLLPKAIRAIGSHGQTIRHIPAGRFPSTCQIGDPNIIAELTGITTVADFRRRDMAAGGQGAPLVPAFHAAMLRTHQQTRVVVNIGGMANISILPASPASEVIGFDTGPGNVLMDRWIERAHGKGWDENGQWAAQGEIDEPLLQRLLKEPYFHLPPPKSTGRELFSESWLLAKLSGKEKAADVQATLCELTARSIAQAIVQTAVDCREVVVCGGGAYNAHLMGRLAVNLPNTTVTSSATYGIEPRWMEAMAFAWLARQTLAGLPGNLPAVTGARQPVILGGIYPANR
ncbi:MAG TPA: anhydro-N-acetylmuramic acid kinase [Gammaproteobacteria bacterium]